jgi:DNA-binding MarR family transcriptional regulator|tara:strand:- start:19994 stop:20593 length:600 start_codon:yes stop_codon:yes gene_type:complete
MNRKFKGIWIPNYIWLSKNLTLQEKVFLVEIDSLDNNGGCYANNSYFGKFFGLSNTRVSLVIKSLIEKGYVISNINQEQGNKRILKTSLTKHKDPIKQKLKHNNTITKTNNKEKEKLFEIFWKLYDKPVSKKPAKDKFLKLSIEDCNKCIDVAPVYVRNTPDKKFRKHAVTWINQECFNDELDDKTDGISNGKLKGMIL